MTIEKPSGTTVDNIMVYGFVAGAGLLPYCILAYLCFIHQHPEKEELSRVHLTYLSGKIVPRYKDTDIFVVRGINRQGLELEFSTHFEFAESCSGLEANSEVTAFANGSVIHQLEHKSRILFSVNQYQRYWNAEWFRWLIFAIVGCSPFTIWTVFELYGVFKRKRDPDPPNAELT